MADAITIRHSTERDLADIRRLAALDEAHAPEGDSLLAFVGGELWAAVPLERGEAVADPFHRTAELVDLLRVRAGQERMAA